MEQWVRDAPEHHPAHPRSTHQANNQDVWDEQDGRRRFCSGFPSYRIRSSIAREHIIYSQQEDRPLGVGQDLTSPVESQLALWIKKEALSIELAELEHNSYKGKPGESKEREHTRRDTGAKHEGQQYKL